MNKLMSMHTVNCCRAAGQSERYLTARVMRTGTESSPGIIISIILSAIKSSVNCSLASLSNTSATSFGAIETIPALPSLLDWMIFCTNFTIFFFAWKPKSKFFFHRWPLVYFSISSYKLRECACVCVCLCSVSLAINLPVMIDKVDFQGCLKVRT